MKRPNFFAAGGLDRVGHLRKDAAWLASHLQDESTRFVPVWRARNLIAKAGDDFHPVFLSHRQIGPLLGNGHEAVLLGVDAGIVYAAIDLSTAEAPLEGLAIAEPEAAFTDLLSVGPLMAQNHGSILAYAKGLLHWHDRHRFCGLCGGATIAAEGGHVRTCTNAECDTTHFPRTDPAVIMLVTDGDRCLLGRQKFWPAGMHSTLAGFVEPGESLEEAVAREVLEEAGIVVDDVIYHSSQPWPFPASIMLGFQATAKTTEIQIDGAELETARWIERDWLADNMDGKYFRLPPRHSIARHMIEDWLGYL